MSDARRRRWSDSSAQPIAYFSVSFFWYSSRHRSARASSHPSSSQRLGRLTHLRTARRAKGR
eukprot:2069366-Heterocapsa_arctica.AAC.1